MIEAVGLEKHFGKTHALRGIDLSVPEGTILGLLGPNGAGKTTAVRILTTLTKPDAGRAQVAGVDVLKHPAEARRRIGVAGQTASLDELLTGRENLGMVGRLYHRPSAEVRKRADELLERFELTDAADRITKTYSGGMRRRLDLAAALMATPPVLFLDEPTTGLDPRSRLSMWELIGQLASGGTTVLMTTQYLEEADRLADDIVVVDHGLVIARGTATELKQRLGGERLEVTVAEGAKPGADRIGAGRAERGAAAHRHARAPGQRAGRLAQRRADQGDSPARRGRRGGGRRRIPDTDAGRRLPGSDRPSGGGRIGQWRGEGMNLRWWLADSIEMLRRNLLHIRRTPELLLDVTITPIMFVLLFRYVFGGAINVGDTTYVNYLMAGIFVQTIVFASIYTSVLLANDLVKGMIDRFRSLPMAQSAVITGRTFTDLLRGALAVAIMWGVGLLVGFRPEGGIANWAAAIGLLLLFGFALSWVGVALGALVRTPEAINGIIFVAVFPLTFASSAFVKTDTMPSWLQAFAERQPMTLVINAVRDLVLGGSGGPDAPAAIAWAVGLLVVFFPIGLWLYQRRTTQ